jgi:hypothetical protein
MALRVAFSDFWPSAGPEVKFLMQALRETTPAEVTTPQDAELLFFSVFGAQHTSFVGTKVQYSGENTRPHWSETDFHIGCNLLDDPRHLRFPFFVTAMLDERFAMSRLEPGPPWRDREFCLFLTSHATRRRGEAFDAISRYRTVTSPGGFRHNTSVPDLEPREGVWRPSKLRYQRNFRFTIAFEHTSTPGYTSEKIVDALLTRSIPIYWGNPRIELDVHPECFINVSDYEDLDALTEHVRLVDTDEELARGYLAREDFLVKPIEAFRADLVRFLGEAAASVGTRSRARERARAVREHALARPKRVAKRMKKRVVEGVRRG